MYNVIQFFSNSKTARNLDLEVLDGTLLYCKRAGTERSSIFPGQIFTSSF